MLSTEERGKKSEEKGIVAEMKSKMLFEIYVDAENFPLAEVYNFMVLNDFVLQNLITI
jgi:hypothetical protein